MGSMTSRPKAPPAPEPIYVPTPIYTYAPPPAYTPPVVAPPSAASEDTATSQAESAARAEQNLLERRRSTIGTVLTGFRGLLNDSVANTRKTLLGE